MGQHGDTIREFVMGSQYVAVGGSFSFRIVLSRTTHKNGRIFHASLVLCFAHLFCCSYSAGSASYTTSLALFVGCPRYFASLSRHWYVVWGQCLKNVVR